MIRKRNVDPVSVLRPKPGNTAIIRLPAADADAIIAGATTAVGVKTLNGTGVFDPLAADTPLYLPFPYMLCFTLGTAADTFTYRVIGYDHRGNYVDYTNNKAGAGATTSTVSGSNPRAICWSRIDSFEITVTTGSGTLDVGFLYSTTNPLIPRLPLPWTVNQVAGAASSIDVAGVQFIDQGGGTIVPAPPSILTMSATVEGGNVLPVAFTTVTVAPTLPMAFAVTMKPEAYAAHP